MPDQRPPDPMFQPPESGHPIPPSAEDLHDTTAAFDAEQWLMHGLLAVHFDERRADYESDADFARRVRARIAEAGPSAGVGPTDDAGPSVDAKQSQAPTDADEQSSLIAASTKSIHVEHAKPARALRWFATRIARRWAVGGGLAAAASVILAVGLVLWSSASRSAAFAAVATRLALTHLDTVPIDLALAAADPVARQQAEARLSTARAELDRLLAEFAAFESQGDTAGADGRGELIRMEWQDVYYALRDTGQFEAALDECDKAIQFLDRTASWNTLHVPLYDRGLILAAAGRYAEARAAYQQSIDYRVEYQVRPNESLATGDRAFGLTPVYLRIADTWLAENELHEARRALDQSDALLRAYCAAVCAECHVNVAADAPLLTVFSAMPAEFRTPPEHETQVDHERWPRDYGPVVPSASVVVKLCEHLYRVARLHRVAASFESHVGRVSNPSDSVGRISNSSDSIGRVSNPSELAAAEQTLATLCELRAVQPYDRHDESRLVFYVPLEQARIAIARRDYRAALDHLAEAEQHVDDPDFYGRRLGLAARGELKILRAAALLGANAPSREWRELLDEALAVKQRVCSDGPVGQCDALRPWAELAEGAH
ncbi:MAG: hypothetical protein CHACPFDD_03630 [Phycisphaerae bacterium]|nr:hypothetical protein [Phycisphaerae bacterium]